MGHRPHVPGGPGRPGAQPDVRAVPGARRSRLGAGMVVLQRTLGNRAMGQLLARDSGATKTAPAPTPAPAATPVFRLLIADEGAHGLADSVVKDALPIVQAELQRIT